MSERERELAAAIVEIFDRLPETKQQRLLGVAEGMDMAAAAERLNQERGKSGL